MVTHLIDQIGAIGLMPDDRAITGVEGVELAREDAGIKVRRYK